MNLPPSTSDKPHLKVALLQDKGSQYDDLEENLTAIKSAAEAANQDNADLLLFPQCFLTGYFRSNDIRATALAINDQILSSLEQISSDNHLAMAIGTYEHFDDNIYNSTLFITPDKGHQGTYRKRMLFAGWEQQHFSRGKAPTIINYHGWNIGILIGYEVEFPELVRQLAHQNIDLLLVSGALIEPLDRVALQIIPTRAIENQIFLAYANRIGREEPNNFLGRSTIIAPDGTNLAAFGREERGILSATLDRSLITQTRSTHNYIAELKQIWPD